LSRRFLRQSHFSATVWTGLKHIVYGLIGWYVRLIYLCRRILKKRLTWRRKRWQLHKRLDICPTRYSRWVSCIQLIYISPMCVKSWL